ncbi:hypothetical protein Nepgr_026321 [Nepenthes gracilis]|uniref:C2H2-type domain-containing protein n=1 Tax=Nepenthes gracilis TaxID=150966 RepID=A0AAD3Y0G3_NEPGR|nr:hypothetical protein Nepgr_026321 [Nepenthes gracilis]
MEASSSSAAGGSFFVDQNQAEQQSSAPSAQKKRNLPGTPNSEAEVIALSPKTLMAKNRFICEVCNKGFQREQNLQLHRRGHNLPWKLRKKNTKDQAAAARKKVYLCPEPTCAHHDPARALGDLTGIKKHFSRKHGEKKFKCERCSKRYAVQSDWKAHSKTCGTREYRCDCGTLFSRRDSFITHRAFCDALAQESTRHPSSFGPVGSHFCRGGSNGGVGLGLSQVTSQIAEHHHDHSYHTTTEIHHHRGTGTPPGQFDHLLTATSSSLGSALRTPSQHLLPSPSAAADFYIPRPNNQAYRNSPNHAAQMQQVTADLQSYPTSNAADFFNPVIFSTASADNNHNNNNFALSSLLLSCHLNNDYNSGGGSVGGYNGCSGGSNLFPGLVLPSLYGTSSPLQLNHSSSNLHTSATALLQKASQMGPISSDLNHSASSSLKGFGLNFTSFGGGQTKSDDTLAPAAGVRSISGVVGGGSVHDRNESSHLQHLMNSFAGGSNSSLSGFSGGYDVNNNTNASTNSKGSFASCDMLTRDFLGVGEIVRSMNTSENGQWQKEQQQLHGGIDIISSSSMDSERNITVPTSQAFW